MKVLTTSKDSVSIEFTNQEFTDILSAISSVRDEYTILDPVMLDVPLERIDQLDEDLMDALEAANHSLKTRPATSYS